MKGVQIPGECLRPGVILYIRPLVVLSALCTECSTTNRYPLKIRMYLGARLLQNMAH